MTQAALALHLNPDSIALARKLHLSKLNSKNNPRRATKLKAEQEAVLAETMITLWINRINS
jgi:hypothetical protein